MPSKIQLDENLWFLYICLQKSDLKTIDFTAVGAFTNLKPPAARMRYTRLRRQIESGTLIGTHGTPFTGSADKIYEASTKRKRGGNAKRGGSDDETEDEEPVGLNANRRGRKSAESGDGGQAELKGLKGKAGGGGDRGKKGKEVKVKEEQDRDFSSTDSEFEDSEDEMPLAKLRKARLGPLLPRGVSGGQPAPKPYVSPYPTPSRIMSPAVGGAQFGGAQYGNGEVSRSMPYAFGQGGDGHGFAALGSAFHSPDGSHLGSNVDVGWGNADWARWQNRISGEEMNGSMQG